MEQSLEQLFADFQRTGDPQYLAQVFDRTSRRVLRVALHLSGDPVVAEDLLQAAFLKTIEARADFDPTRPFLPWLMGILANEARSVARKARRTVIPERLFAPPNPTPEEMAKARELAHGVERALETVPELYREVIVLRVRLGLSAQDMVVVLDRPAATIRSQLHRGLRMLQKSLPPGFALSALFSSPRVRGLDSVRETLFGVSGNVVPMPSPSTILASSGIALKGATVVSIQSKVVCVAVLFLMLGALLISRRPPQRIHSAASEIARTSAGIAAPSVVDPDLGADRAEDARRAAPESEVNTAVSPPLLGAIQVHVVWDDGTTPAEGIGLQIHSTEDSSGSFRPEFGVTNSDGSFALLNLEPGIYCVEPDRIEPQYVKVSSGIESRLSLSVPHSGSVEGRVIDARGLPVAGAEIWISIDSPSWRGKPIDNVAATSDVNGEFRVRDMGRAYHIGARARGFSPSDPVTFSFPKNPSGVAHVELVLPGPGGTLRGHVLDSFGASVPGALLRVDVAFRMHPGTPVVYSSLPVILRADVEGGFEVQDIEPGGIPIEVRAEGFSRWMGRADVLANIATSLEIRMQQAASVSGVITNQSGEPLEGVAVFASLSSAERPSPGAPPANHLNQNWAEVFSRSASYAKTTSKSDGTYRLQGLAPGGANVYADAGERGRATQFIETVPGKKTDWSPVIDLEPQLRVRILDQDGRPLSGSNVSVGWEYSPDLLRRTDAEGRFSLPNCEPVEYRLRVRDPDFGETIATVNGLAPGPEEHLVRVQYTSRAPGCFEGLVLDPDGNPVGGAKVLANRKGSGSLKCRTESGTGHFKTIGLAPASYEILVSHPEHPFMEAGEFELGAGQTVDLGVLRFGRSGTLAITFSREDGKPPPSQLKLELIHLDHPSRWSNETHFDLIGGVARSGPVAPGDCEIRVHGMGLAAARASCEIRAGEETRLELVLGVAGWRILRFLEPPGFPAEGRIHVAVTDSEQVILFNEACHRMPRGLECGLAFKPGRYLVRAWTDSGLRAEQNLVVADSTSLQEPVEFLLH